MTRRIRLLPDEVANQIAAGEVVERPASVVKELVENALDARATRIDVHIERGGKRRVRVSDDGVGMVREDALLCLDRHATSKIVNAEELRTVRSFGFRGEALPSIAAVSWFTLETRDPSEEPGTRVRVKGGKVVGVDDCPRQRGTTVDVEKLFFNAPARAKFLKSVSAEARAVSEVVTTLSLANPTVSLSLHSDDKVLIELPAARGVTERVAALWGREAAARLLAVEGRAGPLEIQGLIQRPDAAKPGARRAYLFVNGRPFRDPELLRAADRGYRTTIPEKARPWLLLYLSAADGSVDVNVHPAKAEVRFRERSSVEAGLEAVVRHALAGDESGAALAEDVDAPVPAVREGSPAEYPGALRDREGGAPQTSLFAVGSDLSEEEGGTAREGSETLAPERPRLWQLHETYVLAETRDALLIIDQHSAHERVLFERLMAAFSGEGRPSQRLLFPLTLRLSPAELEQTQALRGIFGRAGFEVEPFGRDTVIVHSVPDPHPWFDAERCFREMIEELTEGSELVRAARNQHEKIAMTFACKGAIKAGQRLSEEEMQELFDALFATELPHHDVHGRPTIVRLSAGELQKKFGRH